MSVRYGMMALLDRRSMHGYEIRRELESDLGPEWAVNYGQVYSTLERLVRDGLVVRSDTVPGSDAPDRKLYTLTPAGRAELRGWFLTPVGGNDLRRDELFAKIVLGLTSDVDVGQIIQVQRKCELRLMGELTAAKECRDPVLDLPEVLQLDMAILRTEATVRWLDSAEARIGKAAAGIPGKVPVRDSFAVAALRDVEEMSESPEGLSRKPERRERGSR
jgi:DNA-binding PadR family transcriptional regulator